MALADPERVSARERTEVATGSPACAVCHDAINPPGFTLAHFGPLGEEWATHEIVYEGEGSVLAEIPLDGDGNVSGLHIDGEDQTLDGSRAMAELIHSSEQGQLCAARQLFRATHLREAASSDACHVRTLFDAVRSGEPILDILVTNAARESVAVAWEAP